MPFAPRARALARAATSARLGGSRAPAAPVLPSPPPAPLPRHPRGPARAFARVPPRGFAAAPIPPPPSRAFSTAAHHAAPPAPAASSRGGNSWLGAALLLSPSAVCAVLCKWQVDRWEWKKGELARREAALDAPPLDLRDLTARAARDEPVEEYARVAVEGELDLSRGSVRVAPRTRAVHGTPMPGATLITPLRPRPRRGDRTPAPVLVNRGWVPAGWEEPEGGQCLKTSGVTRGSETPGRFTPANVVAAPGSEDGNPEMVDRWHWVDVPAIAAALGLPEHTPLVQLTHDGAADRGNAAPASYPAPVALADLRAFRVNPGDHVNYAATWGGLAAMTAAGAVAALRGRARGAKAVAKVAKDRAR